MDKFFNCVVFSHRLIVNGDGIRSECEASAFLCNAKDKADATEWALRKVNSYEDREKNYDVEVFVMELQTKRFPDLADIKTKVVEIRRAENPNAAIVVVREKADDGVIETADDAVETEFVN